MSNLEQRQEVLNKVTKLTHLINKSKDLNCEDHILQTATDFLDDLIGDLESDIESEVKDQYQNSYQAKLEHQEELLLINQYRERGI